MEEIQDRLKNLKERFGKIAQAIDRDTLRSIIHLGGGIVATPRDI